MRSDTRLQHLPPIRGGYVPSPPANPENQRFINALLYDITYSTLKYASQTHSKDSLTHQYNNNVVMIN